MGHGVAGLASGKEEESMTFTGYGVETYIYDFGGGLDYVTDIDCVIRVLSRFVDLRL